MLPLNFNLASAKAAGAAAISPRATESNATSTLLKIIVEYFNRSQTFRTTENSKFSVILSGPRISLYYHTLSKMYLLSFKILKY